MSATIILVGDTQRANAKRLIDRAPPGYVVTLRERTRSGEQNAKMHALIADIIKADPLGHGYDMDDWKTVLVKSFKGELRLLRGLDGELVPAGRQTSKMTVRDMADFITFIEAYGAREGVRWTDTQEMAA